MIRGRDVVVHAGLAVGLWLALVTAPGEAVAVSEYRVKAAFLLNFGKFIEWPEAALAPGTLDICVLGEDPFGSDLDEILEGRTVGSRQVRARRIASASRADGCAMLFLGRAEGDRLGEVVSAVAGGPVLLVGERPGFASQGGMVNFVEIDQKIRFEINEAAARRAGLKISSQLLKLATIVEGR